jgi:ferric-dicitrate binding protein FerR (iron transport regulator)
MSQANSKPVSARVLDAAIAWQLCLDCGNGSEVEQAEFAKWYAPVKNTPVHGCNWACSTTVSAPPASRRAMPCSRPAQRPPPDAQNR